MRIVQISDTHLSQDKPDFSDNWPPLARRIADQHPDLAIHTGDVTIDGAGAEADLRHAAQLMNGLGTRWRAVPGNHDVGDARHAGQPVNAERLRAWQRHFGPDRWVEDVAEGAERWRLVGLDAMLMGSGEPEHEQALWLEQVMAEAEERRIAWFLHRPLLLEDPGEGDTGYWSINRSRAERFWRWCGGAGLPSSPADICTKRGISPLRAHVISGRRLRAS